MEGENHHRSKRRRPTAPVSVAAASLAASNAFVVTNVAGRLISAWAHPEVRLRRDDLLSTLQSIATRGLRADLSSGLAYQLLMNGPRLGLYDPLQPALRKTGLFRDSEWGNKYASSAISGAIGGTLGLPVHTVRVDEHLSGNLARGIGHVVRTRGLRYLFHGLGFVIPRFMIFTMAQLPTYELAKECIGLWSGLQNGTFLLSLPAALVSSSFTVLCLHPIDVVANSRRLLAARTEASLNSAAILSAGGELSSSSNFARVVSARQGYTDRLLEIARTEGLRGLLRGWLGHYYRLGLHIFLTTITLEQLKQQACARLPAFSIDAEE